MKKKMVALLALCMSLEMSLTPALAAVSENHAVISVAAEAESASGDDITNEQATSDADFTIDSNGVLTKYNGSGGDVVIPNTVTSIGNEAFRWHSRLTSITIPNTVTSIGDYAFSNCNGLTSITIPASVTSIGNDAFSYCSNLTSITIPNGVTSMSDGIFAGCSSLTSITVPNGVTSIGNWAFSYCSSLTSITIPNGVTSIGKSAFYDCSSLTSITIPNGVTSIGDSTFFECSNLTSITIPNSVTSIGKAAFLCCRNLTSITIPDSVTNIDMYAFAGCSSLTSITIPDSVTSIGEDAFSGCKLNLNVYEGSYAHKYANDNALTYKLLPKKSAIQPQNPQQPQTPQQTPAAVGTKLTDKKSGMKYKVTGAATTGSTVTYVGNAKRKAKTVTIPKAVTIGGVSYKVTAIADNAFKGNKYITTIIIGSNVRKIGKYAFKDCKNLKKIITKTKKLTSKGVAKKAFAGISKKTVIKVPKRKYKAYKKLFRKKGLSKAVKVTK